MKHLFIVNPASSKIRGKTELIVSDIHAIMARHPTISYDVHVTRWHRDALGFSRKYALSCQDELLRVHVLGGTGTLFEVVNGIVGLPNVELAAYPIGRNNTFLHHFSGGNSAPFHSIERQLAAPAVRIDLLRCNSIYSISNILTGVESHVDRVGDDFIDKTRLPSDFCYALAALLEMLKKNLNQHYKLTMDGKEMDGEYLSIMAANQPWYSRSFRPAVEARPDSGVMDLYFSRDSTRLRRFYLLREYLKGNYAKHPDTFSHYQAKVLHISSPELMWITVDGEAFYGNSFEYEIQPGILAFTNPMLLPPREEASP